MPAPEKRLKLALPNGELREDAIDFLQRIGLSFQFMKRRYTAAVQNMPIDLVVVRASDVPRVVKDERSEVAAGISGSDLLWEANGGRDAAEGEELPVYEVKPDAKRWSLFVGVRSDYREEVEAQKHRPMRLPDLSGTMVATEYPNVARSYLRDAKIRNVEVYPVGGTNESLPDVFPHCHSVLGILVTGLTARANNIDTLTVFHEGSTRLIQSKVDTLDVHESLILDDLRERIYQVR